MDKAEGTGERVGGYRVVRRLATGGTSDVLLAMADGPLGFERPVVLKLLLSQYKHDEEFKSMFAREAAAYARLGHPAIVRLYDFFSNAEQLVMVLEYIDGPPLSRLRGMLKTVGQPLETEASLFVAACVFDALAAAHAATDHTGDPAPVIHRDVNPSNVLVGWDAHVKLADFGIAKVTGVNHQSSAGLIKGTYGYMAPEQVKGELVTPRADVYAGAIMLWEMLTKRRAFIRGALPEIEVLRELAEPRIVSIDILRPDLDRGVRDALKRALEPRAEKRTITAEELASTLRAAVSVDEGRERLAKALALVRHEPKGASTTSVPPPMKPASDEAETGKLFPQGLVPPRPGGPPRPTPPPRPAVVPPRKTAPYGAAAAAAATPKPPVLAPPRPGAAASRATNDAPPETMPGGIPVSEEGLASLLEPSRPRLGPSSEAQPSGVPVFDSLVEPPELVGATGRPSEKLRLGAAGILNSGAGLRDAIDEILRDAPKKEPPPPVELAPLATRAGAAPASAPDATVVASVGAMGSTHEDPKGVAEAASRELGHLPPAPPPLEVGLLGKPTPALSSTLLVDTAPRSMPSSFPAMNRTLSMGDAGRGTDRVDVHAPTVQQFPAELLPPRPSAQAATHTAPMAAVANAVADVGSERTELALVGTAPMAPVAPPHPLSTAKMPAYVAPGPGAAGGPPAPPKGAPATTLPLSAVSPSSPRPARNDGGPPPAVGPPPPPPQAQAAARQAVSTVPPTRTNPPFGADRAPPSEPPPARRLSVVGLLAILIIAIATGVAGMLAYVRWQKARAIAEATTTHATPRPTPSALASAPPSASAPVLASAPAPASPPASALASASASASARAPASASASASPPASALASASASASAPSDLPPNTGRVKTTTAAPGRRIFVDERTVGQTPESVVVKCGTRAIRLGSAGSTQSIDVPCGAEITVYDR